MKINVRRKENMYDEQLATYEYVEPLIKERLEARRSDIDICPFFSAIVCYDKGQKSIVMCSALLFESKREADNDFEENKGAFCSRHNSLYFYAHGYAIAENGKPVRIVSYIEGLETL